MPTLDWIGKAAVVNHHALVPYRLFHCDAARSVGEAGEGNLLIEGDNLQALKALLPYYRGQIKCIYIDPPYNTGNENWVYNDNVNSPLIRKWLGEVVGSQSQDLSRDDKWLCMMYPRLVLLRELLREDGAIFISIDDNEVHSLRHVMDEIFGSRNFVATVVWQKMDSPKNTALHLSEDHDYILIYAKRGDAWRPNKLQRTEVMIARYKNPDNDPRGPWLLSDLAARNFYAQGRYPIATPSGRTIQGPPAGSYWRVNKERFDELERDGRIWWGKTGSNRPGIKRFLSEVQEGVVPQTLWLWKDVGSTRNAKQELSQIMAAGASNDLFTTPKPSGLIERILEIATNPGDVILDSFAGSGTSGHAVLKVNRANPDKARRRFILVEIDSGIARELTAERLRRLAQGYTNAKGERVQSLGGGFRYCTLGEPLFDANGKIRDTVKFDDLARHIFFTETGEPLPKRANGHTPLIGQINGTAYYLLWDRRNGAGILDGATLRQLPKHEGPKVVYANGCRLSTGRLKRENIIFKQIPYEIKEN